MSKVAVPTRVLQGLEAVRQSGLTNMLDAPAVMLIAEEFGFPETTAWIRANRCAYAEGIFHGFTVEEEGGPCAR